MSFFKCSTSLAATKCYLWCAIKENLASILQEWKDEIWEKAYNSQPNKVIKHSQRIRQQKPTNCLRVFDHFVGLVLKELNGLKSSLWEKSYFVGLALKGLKSLVTKLSYGKGTAKKYGMVPFNPYEVWLQTVVCYEWFAIT